MTAERSATQSSPQGEQDRAPRLNTPADKDENQRNQQAAKDTAAVPEPPIPDRADDEDQDPPLKKNKKTPRFQGGEPAQLTAGEITADGRIQHVDEDCSMVLFKWNKKREFSNCKHPLMPASGARQPDRRWRARK